MTKEELEKLVEDTARLINYDCDGTCTERLCGSSDLCNHRLNTARNFLLSQPGLLVEVEETCKECGGTGTSHHMCCSTCNGNGKVKKIIPLSEALKGVGK